MKKIEKALELYNELGSLRKVGREIGVSYETVRKWLKKRNKIISHSLWLRQIFDDMFVTVEKHYPEVMGMSIRAAYRWFKSHGFPGSWRTFYLLWTEATGEFL